MGQKQAPGVDVGVPPPSVRRIRFHDMKRLKRMHRRHFLLSCLAIPVAGCHPGAVRPTAHAITLRIDVTAAEELLAALERKSIAEAEIDRLLAIRGVSAAVDNTTKYLPADTRDVFRVAIRNFVETGQARVGHFGLASAHAWKPKPRALIEKLRASGDLAAGIAAPVNRYRPDAGMLDVTAYCVAGGASDGFVIDGDPERAFFMAIDRAQGDLEGVKLNMTHELYHVAQRAARSSVAGLDARVFLEATAPATVRLLTTTMDEGTATYVADARLFTGRGPYIDMWRAAYAKNAPAERIKANFALFDSILDRLARGALDWRTAYEEGFAGMGPPLYFVGHEMAKALDQAHGPQRIGAYFTGHPAAFFRDYVALYKKDPGLAPARFSATTEKLLGTSLD